MNHGGINDTEASLVPPFSTDMPTYEYLTEDGDITERIVPIAERDEQAGLTRIEIPRMCNVTFNTPAPWMDLKSNLRKGFEDVERKGEWSSIGFTKEQVKAVHGL